MFPEPILIVILTVIVFAIGFALGCIRPASHWARIRRQEAREARLFYERKYNPGERRI